MAFCHLPKGYDGGYMCSCSYMQHYECLLLFLQIGSIFYPCSFTVLDASNVDFLFGLDMLRKHQCIIDFKENVLRVGGGEVSVPFLQGEFSFQRRTFHHISVMNKGFLNKLLLAKVQFL
ncbi:hypothetical protein Taro_040361 [Colocasia esculenta]|uniref:Aspartic peptidase DDI1-type domain-containing protein n=1 Tax=Colocasia esculenta TaxID=4460 RepID=A0A843WQ53_COLES|nr:hypothetical protein [Colocasia esculenta]